MCSFSLIGHLAQPLPSGGGGVGPASGHRKPRWSCGVFACVWYAPSGMMLVVISAWLHNATCVECGTSFEERDPSVTCAQCGRSCHFECSIVHAPRCPVRNPTWGVPSSV